DRQRQLRGPRGHPPPGEGEGRRERDGPGQGADEDREVRRDLDRPHRFQQGREHRVLQEGLHGQRLRGGRRSEEEEDLMDKRQRILVIATIAVAAAFLLDKAVSALVFEPLGRINTELVKTENEIKKANTILNN